MALVWQDFTCSVQDLTSSDQMLELMPLSRLGVSGSRGGQSLFRRDEVAGIRTAEPLCQCLSHPAGLFHCDPALRRAVDFLKKGAVLPWKALRSQSLADFGLDGRIGYWYTHSRFARGASVRRASRVASEVFGMPLKRGR